MGNGITSCSTTTRRGGTLTEEETEGTGMKENKEIKERFNDKPSSRRKS